MRFLMRRLCNRPKKRERLMLSNDIATIAAHGAMSEFLLIAGAAQGIVGSLWATDAAEPTTTMIGVEVAGVGAAAAGVGVGVAGTTATTAEAAGITAEIGTIAAVGTAVAAGAEEAGAVVGENITEIGVRAGALVVVPPEVLLEEEALPVWVEAPAWAVLVAGTMVVPVWADLVAAADLLGWEDLPVAEVLPAVDLLVAVAPPVVDLRGTST